MGDMRRDVADTVMTTEAITSHALVNKEERISNKGPGIALRQTELGK